MKRIAVVRVRGGTRSCIGVTATLEMLHLLKVNHCVVITDTPTYKGMLQRAKDYITWGEIGKDEMQKLLVKRARITGDKKLTDEYIKKNTKFETIAKFTEEFMNGKAELKDITGLKLFFRLNPPKGGYESVKHQYANKGTLGNRGAAMDALLDRMLR